MVRRNPSTGFTLIELSIVLVIIGLIVGGVLVGQDLIRAAHARAQIAQIEKYQTAVRTFQGKYAALPGDMDDPTAQRFGFPSLANGRGSGSFCGSGPKAGQGDGNGVIEGTGLNCVSVAVGFFEYAGETAVFWRDLSYAGLIEGTFNSAIMWSMPGPGLTTANLGVYFPVAKIRSDNYVYVWSDGLLPVTGGGLSNGVNYFGVEAINAVTSGGWTTASANIRVLDAYTIDNKIDDGVPVSGRVLAAGVNGNPYWATTAVSASPATCYDNGGNAANVPTYSVTANGGSGLNCWLTFQFQ